MKALVKYAPGPGNVEIRDIPEPVISDEEVKIRIRAAGFCGTDAEILSGDFKTKIPVVLGHEGVGEIAEIGKRVRDIRLGDRVILETSRETCGSCYYCRTGDYHLCIQRKGAGYGIDGVFAEYAKAPGDKVHRIPENLTFEEAVVMEPINTATRAATKIAEIRGGDSVLITGSGPIGLGVLQVISACGASKVIVVGRNNQARLNAAKALGATCALKAGEDVRALVNKLTQGLGVDLFFECSGNTEAFLEGLSLVRKRGQVIVVGVYRHPVELDLNQILWKELVIRTVVTSGVYTDWKRTLAMAESGQIQLKPFVSHVYPLENWQKLVRQREEGLVIKGLLIP